MDSNDSILKSAQLFFAGTLLSRFSGLFREMAMAFCFGCSPAVAAFMVAYRISNLFRRLLGEGNLQSGFVPYFEWVDGENPKKAIEFYRDISFSLTLLLIGAVALIEGALYFACFFLNEGWKEIATLAMWMGPGLIFICLYGLNSALLQCKKRYFLTGAAPALFNLFWIALAFLVESMTSLAVGITLAFGLQWLVTSFQVRKEVFAHLSWKEWLQPNLFSQACKQLMKPISLGVVGVGAMQINSLLDTIFARVADLSGPAYLWYAIRVQQLPLALFGIALSGALLPPLARAIQSHESERYRELLRGALKQAAALMIPCSFGLFALGERGLSLLYRRGDFSAQALQETLHCLWGYGIGLFPAVLVLLLANGFYARKSYWVPVIASLSSVVLNILLNTFFIFVLKLGAMSVAIATSSSSLLNALLLTYFLKREVGPLYDFRFIGKLLLCGGIPSLAVVGIGGNFFVQAAVFGAGVLGIGRILRIEELFIPKVTQRLADRRD